MLQHALCLILQLEACVSQIPGLPPWFTVEISWQWSSSRCLGRHLGSGCVEGVQEEEGRISRILNASSQSITVCTQ